MYRITHSMIYIRISNFSHCLLLMHSMPLPRQKQSWDNICQNILVYSVLGTRYHTIPLVVPSSSIQPNAKCIDLTQNENASNLDTKAVFSVCSVERARLISFATKFTTGLNYLFYETKPKSVWIEFCLRTIWACYSVNVCSVYLVLYIGKNTFNIIR